MSITGGCRLVFAPSGTDAGPIRFVIVGAVTGLRAATPADPLHPALVPTLGSDGKTTEILVPPAAWPAAREVFAAGQMLAIDGDTDSATFARGSWLVATRITLLGTVH